MKTLGIAAFHVSRTFYCVEKINVLHCQIERDTQSVRNVCFNNRKFLFIAAICQLINFNKVFKNVNFTQIVPVKSDKLGRKEVRIHS